MDSSPSGKSLFFQPHVVGTDTGFYTTDFNNRNSKHKRSIDLESVTVITWEQDAESGAAAKCQKIHDAPFTVATEGLFSYSNMGPDVVHPTVTPAANPTLQGKFSVTEDELLRQVIADYGKVRFCLCSKLRSAGNFWYRILA